MQPQTMTARRRATLPPPFARVSTSPRRRVFRLFLGVLRRVADGLAPPQMASRREPLPPTWLRFPPF